MKDFKELMRSYLGDYSEDYCKRHALFYAVKIDGSVSHKTRQIISIHEDVINTDLNFILGEYQTISVDGKDRTAVNRLEEILEANEWDSMKRLAIIQGLVLGTTAIKIGRDEKDRVRIGLVNLVTDTLTPKYENGEIVEWELLSNNTVEKFRKDSYVRKSGATVKETPNQYGEFWIFVIQNRPSLTDDWEGISEWEAISEIVDEINSIQSRIARIEELYANPKVLVAGSDKANFGKDDNIWFIREAGGSISILEFKGDIMTTMQNRSNCLMEVLKNKCPELVLSDLGNISGYALKLKMQRLEKKIAQLKETYFRVFEKMFRLVYLMDSGRDVDFQFNSEITIPTDTESLLKELIVLEGLGIISRKTMAESLGYNFEEEQKRVAEETSYFREVDRDESGQNTAGDSKPGPGLTA